MNVCTKITDPSFFDSEEIKGTEKKETNGVFLL
jgi:hypothetical protein